MRRNVSRSGLARKNRAQRYQTKCWVDRMPDVPCFVLGNAPSILEYDLTPLERYFTIGVNRVFQLIDPTILLWQDISLWKSEYHKIHNLRALKVAREVADPRRLYYNFHLKGGAYRFEQPKKSHILFGRGSSGPIAVELAYSLGCRPIILVGMDCQRGKNGEGDFYGENKYWQPHTLDNCEIGLKFIQKECPVQVKNVGRSRLWSQQSLPDVLNEIDLSFARSRAEYVRQLLANSS